MRCVLIASCLALMVAIPTAQAAQQGGGGAGKAETSMRKAGGEQIRKGGSKADDCTMLACNKAAGGGGGSGKGGEAAHGAGGGGGAGKSKSLNFTKDPNKGSLINANTSALSGISADVSPRADSIRLAAGWDVKAQKGWNDAVDKANKSGQAGRKAGGDPPGGAANKPDATKGADPPGGRMNKAVGGGGGAGKN